MTTQEMPPIQLFVNLVVVAPGGQVLLARYDKEDERWMIPYADLEPYEHPDETARRGLERLSPLAVRSPAHVRRALLPRTDGLARGVQLPG
jgi:hypothetical protein